MNRYVRVFTTTSEQHMFVEDTTAALAQCDSLISKEANEVIIDTSKRFQEIDGFGASFTDASAYLINRKLTPEKREEVMKALFDHDEGIGLSTIRNPMGSSDYSRDYYSYDNVREGRISDDLLPAVNDRSRDDFDLSRFTIAHDLEDIIPLTLKAMALNPSLKLFASPWSAPGWMKTTGSMVGGRLREDCYDAFADYFVKFIKEYEKLGLHIYAITPQNEPLYIPVNYSGMGMDAQEQLKFISGSLGPAFKRVGITTKILTYDHNWDEPEYPETVLGSDAGKYVDGVAWHWYGGRPDDQTRVHDKFPEKETYFTEGSGGDWIPPFRDAFRAFIEMGIEIIRNYSRNFIIWNMALDENKGPVVPEFGTSTCRGVVKVNQETGELTYNLDYYALAHFSKFTRSGAVRVASSQTEIVKSLAMQNTDGSICLVLLNTDDDSSHPVLIKIDSSIKIIYQLPAGATATFII